MNAVEKNLLVEKLAGFDSQLDLERASTIPRLWYVDDLVHAAEREVVFGDSWLLACRIDEVADPGSYVTLEIAGEPLLIIRDVEDLQLRALSNVCRHRAAKVATCASGVATKLRCHYHGWTYDTKGQLKAVPEFGGVCDFSQQDNSLPEWSLDTWGPYVFVRAPGASRSEPLVEFLKPLPSLCSGLGIEKMKFVERKEYLLNCNWKVFVDNYLDGCYHCNTIHPALAGAIDYIHYRTECDSNTVVQISPLKPLDGSEVGALRKGRDAYYTWIWPNMMFNIYEGLMDINVVLPLGPNRCRVIFDFFFEDTDGPDQQAMIEQSLELAHKVQLEDAAICEEVYAGLQSATFNTGRFSVRRESGVYHFHQLLAKKLQTFTTEDDFRVIKDFHLCEAPG